MDSFLFAIQNIHPFLTVVKGKGKPFTSMQRNDGIRIYRGQPITPINPLDYHIEKFDSIMDFLPIDSLWCKYVKVIPADAPDFRKVPIQSTSYSETDIPGLKSLPPNPKNWRIFEDRDRRLIFASEANRPRLIRRTVSRRFVINPRNIRSLSRSLVENLTPHLKELLRSISNRLQPRLTTMPTKGQYILMILRQAPNMSEMYDLYESFVLPDSELPVTKQTLMVAALDKYADVYPAYNKTDGATEWKKIYDLLESDINTNWPNVDVEAVTPAAPPP